ncbi:MAG: NifB/NifX family molybdenum-iron cluster-binding protein [Oscillospiraceae bacterium]|nr:NifB/NifX family molybdenum-iron cluster-binding protein [Oscillospiraceae bacterium]
MKIAVTYENGQVFQHFGRSPAFKVYDVEEGEIRDSRVVETNGAGHSALGGFLRSLEADVLICGGIGPGAQMAMANAGASGDADGAVRALLDGTLLENSVATCGHHEHHHEDGCGSRGCP